MPPDWNAAPIDGLRRCAARTRMLPRATAHWNEGADDTRRKSRHSQHCFLAPTLTSWMLERELENVRREMRNLEDCTARERQWHSRKKSDSERETDTRGIGTCFVRLELRNMSKCVERHLTHAELCMELHFRQRHSEEPSAKLRSENLGWRRTTMTFPSAVRRKVLF